MPDLHPELRQLSGDQKASVAFHRVFLAAKQAYPVLTRSSDQAPDSFLEAFCYRKLRVVIVAEIIPDLNILGTSSEPISHEEILDAFILDRLFDLLSIRLRDMPTVRHTPNIHKHLNTVILQKGYKLFNRHVAVPYRENWMLLHHSNTIRNTMGGHQLNRAPDLIIQIPLR
jgi:hypothetical protein